MMNSSLESAIYAAKQELSQRVEDCAVRQLADISATLSRDRRTQVSGIAHARAIADLLVELGQEQNSSFFAHMHAQIAERQAQKSLVPLCCQHWPVTLGKSFELLQAQFVESGHYLSPQIDPSNFDFSLPDSERLVPLSLLTLEKQELVSKVIEMVRGSSYGLPDLAHALLFAMRYPHVLDQAQIIIPCRPWRHPGLGLSVLLLCKKAKQILTCINVDARVCVGNMLVLVVGENRSALMGQQILG